MTGHSIPQQPHTVGPYRVERELGRGGSAVVYLARHIDGGEDVAVKVLRPELAQSMSAERFLREIRVTAGLDHPGIVRLLDSGEAGEHLFFVLPYMDGGTLRGQLQREKQIAVAEAIRIACAVGGAIAHAHGRGVIHRDIKPENILFGGNRVCLADFGVARALDASGADRLTETGLSVGTVAYMSPEQGSGERDIDGRSDVYTLACVLYEMLAGVPAFVGATSQSVLAQRMTRAPQNVRIYRPLVPERVAAVIEKALQPTPADRHQTAAEFVRELSAAAEASTALPDPRPMVGTFGKNRRFVGIGALLVLVTIALFAIQDRAGRWSPSVSPPVLHRSRIAVAPFNVHSDSVAISEWRYGLVDVLARNFDGAGPLEAVSASIIIAGWDSTNRADRASSDRLASRTGAGLVLFGDLEVARTGVQLRASVYDAVERRSIHEWTISGTESAVVALADSLTGLTLSVLGETRAIAAVPRASIAWPHLIPLKAFLRGEQYRRTNNHSQALREYTSAIKADSTFALAYRGARRAATAIRGEQDSLARAYAMAAGARNRHLAPRDSLLIVADSLGAACGFRGMYDAPCQNRVQQMFIALETAARRYPDDPDVFEQLGEARTHYGALVGESSERAYSAFARAITLDSGYAPAYFHATQLAIGLTGGDSASRIVARYLRQVPGDTRFKLVADALLAASKGRALDQSILAAASAGDILGAAAMLQGWQGPPHPAEAFYRFVAESSTLDERSRYMAKLYLYADQLYHGRLREVTMSLASISATDVQMDIPIFAALANNPSAGTSALLDGWLERSNVRAIVSALSWWGATRDTTLLSRAVSHFRSVIDAHPATPSEKAVARYGVRAAEMYLSLAVGDSARAGTSAIALAHTPCALFCTSELLFASALLRRRNQPDSAATLLDAHPMPSGLLNVREVLWQLERGRVAVARLATSLHDTARVSEVRKGANAYAVVVGAWCHADSALQASAREAREGLRRLDPSRRPAC
ncbi:MAG: serine/threonine-protein kinase [Gemmatimonas sp.]